MGIGTSLGAHFEDDFDLQAGKEYTPPEIKPKNELVDSNVITPNQAAQDKQLNDIEMKELGGLPISLRIFPQKERSGKKIFHNGDDNIIDPESKGWEALTQDKNEFTSQSILEQGYQRYQGNPQDHNIKYEIEDRQNDGVVTPDSRGREWLNQAIEPYEAAMTPAHTPMSEALGSRDIPLPVAGKTHPSNYVDPDFYETQLDEESNVHGTEADFQKWKAKMAPNDSGEDYDLRGAFMANVKPDPETGHWPDKFKKPNHPTFSDQSKYAKDRPELAGSWDGDRYIPSVGAPAISDSVKFSEGNNGLNAIFGTGDVERFKLWPERMLRDGINAAHEVMTGKKSMWSFNDNTGEFHTSIEGMEQAHALMPFVLSGTLPGRIALKEPAKAETTSRAADIPPEEAARLARQPSNIEEPPAYQPITRNAGEDDTSYALRVIADVLERPEETPGTPAFNRRYGYDEQPTGSSVHPDQMSDEAFLRWGEYQPYGEANPMTHAQEARWARLSEAERDSIHEDFVQQPWHPEDAIDDQLRNRFIRDDIDSWMEERAEHNKAVITEARKLFEEKADKVKTKGTISMLRGPSNNSNYANFSFISKDGVPGEMSINLRNSGKDLHVSWIGGVGGNGANDIGRSEMKNLFKLLAEEFPKGEYVTGFRVSGARGARGRPDDAKMRIPGRGHNGGPRIRDDE